MKHTQPHIAKTIAFCGLLTAAGVVILLLGSFLGLGIYAAPMLVGLVLIPVGREYGNRYQVLTWLAISLLGFLLVPDIEETLIFACLLGWYPILRPRLAKLPFLPALLLKLLVFNAIIILLEMLLMFVILPNGEIYGKLLLLVLLILANFVFLVYDMLIPRLTLLYDVRLRRRLPF